ncbi:MAG: hypothetical protein N2450_04210 [bacterium]|nr:hypothetical protein [bacterium]
MKNGSLHHIEINVTDLNRSRVFWEWLLKKFNYTLYQEWKSGFSYLLQGTYIVFVQVDPHYLQPPFHRKRVGLNHIAFYVNEISLLEQIKHECKIKEIPQLYQNQSLEDNVLFLEDPDRIKVELRYEKKCHSSIKEQFELTKTQLFALSDFIVSLKEHDYNFSKHLLINAFDKNIQPNCLYEAILQTYLFYGFPSAIEGMRLFTEIVSNTNYQTTYPIECLCDDWLEKGKIVCQKVYTDHYPRLIEHFRKLSPELTSWMLIEGYGKVLSRPYLKLSDREFLIVAMLSQTTFVRQFESHLYGCKNTGVPMNWILEWMESTRTKINETNWLLFMEFYNKHKND